MRVIAGSARSLALRTPDGQGTRPTSDRIKETLFNMIGAYIPDSKFLDLYAGSGQMGIEALSRGASLSVFVEKGKVPLECIKDNLAFTKLSDNAQVIAGDVFVSLGSLKSKGPFDFIFMDPPYADENESRVLSLIREYDLLADDGVIIIEADIHRDFSFVEESGLGFYISKIKKYKTNMHVFIENE